MTGKFISLNPIKNIFLIYIYTDTRILLLRKKQLMVNIDLKVLEDMGLYNNSIIILTEVIIQKICSTTV